MTKLKSAAEKKSRLAMERGLGRAGALCGRAEPEGRSRSLSLRISRRRKNVPRPDLVSYRHVSDAAAWHQNLQFPTQFE
jgi:hypothetical protein